MQDAQRAHMALQAIQEGQELPSQLTSERLADISRRYTHAYREGLTRARPPSRSVPMTPVTM